MIFINAPQRPRMVAPAVGRQGFDLRVMLFLTLIGFLLWGSLGGKGFERRAPDNLGLQVVLSADSGREPVVSVGRVRPKSPAEFAGLQPGDRITGINGRLISSAEMLRHMILTDSRRKALKLTVIRNGQSREIHLQLNQLLRNAQAPEGIALRYKSLSIAKQILVIAVFLKIVAIMFFFLYQNILNRTAIVLLSATGIMLAGIFFGVYTPLDAFAAIKFNTVSLLLGMGIISVVLNEAGFFGRVAGRLSRYAGQNHMRLLTGFCLLTYFFSLLVNNLTTILIIVPITLQIAATLQVDPRPIIIGEIIASNLGGASTMVGDFPNMLIAAETGIAFSQFIIYMMPLCLILLGVLLVYLKLKSAGPPPCARKDIRRPELPTTQPTRLQRRAARRAIFVLCHVLFLFIISSRISLNPSTVALLGGLSLFLFSGIDRRRILSKLGFNDILFFIGLFVVVGGLEASGLLVYLSRGLAGLSFGKPWALCLVLMYSAAALTAFLNAGPTAAIFFPVVMGFPVALPLHVLWWALSLGVLAGSSATIFGATAGPVAATLVEKFGAGPSAGVSGRLSISFGQFTRIGFPVMFLFLSVSSMYVVYLCFHF